MNAHAPVGRKLALIVPRLGSSHDGEVLASAKAIGRTLKGAGLDWHDLSAMIAAACRDGRETSRPKGQWPRGNEAVAPIWSELNRAGREAWILILCDQTGLTTWERGFAADIADRLDTGRLSAKQQIVLNRLIARAFQYGASP
jgi:hypothetical protein